MRSDRIVTTTASEGSRIASVGGCSVVGRLCSGLGERLCVFTRSVFWSDVMTNAAEMLAWPD